MKKTNESLDPTVVASIIGAVAQVTAVTGSLYVLRKIFKSNQSSTQLSTLQKIKNFLTGSEKKLLNKIIKLGETDEDIANIVHDGLGRNGFKPNKRNEFIQALTKHGISSKEVAQLSDRLSRYAREQQNEDVDLNTSINRVLKESYNNVK